jgi:hypothetical protein
VGSDQAKRALADSRGAEYKRRSLAAACAREVSANAVFALVQARKVDVILAGRSAQSATCSHSLL